MFGYGVGSLVNIADFGFFTQASFIAGSAIFIGVGALKLIFSIMGMIQVGITRNWIFSIVNKGFVFCGSLIPRLKDSLVHT